MTCWGSGLVDGLCASEAARAVLLAFRAAMLNCCLNPLLCRLTHLELAGCHRNITGTGLQVRAICSHFPCCGLRGFVCEAVGGAGA